MLLDAGAEPEGRSGRPDALMLAIKAGNVERSSRC
jgi:hypothetical protein